MPIPNMRSMILQSSGCIPIFFVTRNLRGFNSIRINEIKSAIETNISVYSLGKDPTKIAPIAVPIPTGIASNKEFFHGIFPDFEKFTTLVKNPTNTGNRLVALATKGSIPQKIIMGKVTAVPLLATVFINPDTTPIRIKKSHSI
jgi:hypothetical protein